MSDARQERPTNEDASLSAHNAYLGSATLSMEGTFLSVHALCWPIVSTTWRSMAQAWESIGGWRNELDTVANVQSPSWIAECAPQFGSPFRGTTAEESTIAAILNRTPMSVAISVLDAAQATSAIQRDGLLSCLTSYDEYVKVPGRLSCRMLVARGRTGTSDPEWVDAFARGRQRMPDAKSLRSMELRNWTDPVEPLPLEAAHIIAASIARYRADADMANPITEAVRPKLAHPLELLDRPSKKRR